MRFLKHIYLFFFIFIWTACVTSSMKLAESELSWSQSAPDAGNPIDHSIYLIGDVGGSQDGESTIPLIELEKHLKTDHRDDDATNVIFLGDNIYPVGMPPIGHEDRADAEHKLNMQLESVRAFEGAVTFVPGNHDWYKYGREGLRRQEEYIETYLSKYNEELKDFFRPSDGCGNVDVMHISDKLAIMFVDSHWFLTNKAKDEDYSDCEIKTRKEFAKAFADSLATLKDVNVLLTMHHPLYTVGSHGGYYRWYSHFLPLTEYKKLLGIPLPFSGTIVNAIRPKISEQDTESAPYATYRNLFIPEIERHGATIVAAGHEHTLQYHEINDVHYIVSGSGSKRGPVGKKSYTKFAYGNYGYALVDYFKNGEIWLSFYANNEDNSAFVEIYRSQLK